MLDAEPGDTADDVKLKIEEEEGTRVDMQRLIFHGKEISGHELTLKERGVTHGSLLFMILRLLGGALDLVVRSENESRLPFCVVHPCAC